MDAAKLGAANMGAANMGATNVGSDDGDSGRICYRNQPAQGSHILFGQPPHSDNTDILRVAIKYTATPAGVVDRECVNITSPNWAQLVADCA